MKTKIILPLLFVAASLVAARAQDAVNVGNESQANPSTDNQPVVCVPPPPAVVYEAPVVYAAPVVYQAPVIYYAPVYYGVSPAACALNVCGALQNNAALSTVTYIGGHQVSYQVAPPCNSGSTVVYIGQHSAFR
ncbi:MAG TPA: hypothetical protein VG938_14990 [Verrucomicrobiae bacterium]|jgi:hypothetical protein|nr:hypothetical protein [Verrucomicrobiae bacterium]